MQCAFTTYRITCRIIKKLQKMVKSCTQTTTTTYQHRQNSCRCTTFTKWWQSLCCWRFFSYNTLPCHIHSPININSFKKGHEDLICTSLIHFLAVYFSLLLSCFLLCQAAINFLDLARYNFPFLCYVKGTVWCSRCHVQIPVVFLNHVFSHR